MYKIKIDTSNNKLTVIELYDQQRLVEKITSDSKILKSESVLLLIDKILSNHNISLPELRGIEVVSTNGSFTGLRVGVSVANALGYLLNLSVNGEKIGDFISPVYN